MRLQHEAAAVCKAHKVIKRGLCEAFTRSLSNTA